MLVPEIGLTPQTLARFRATPRRAGAGAAFGLERQRARARLGCVRARRGAGGGGHALGRVHAAARGRPDHRRRGTRRQLQAAGRHALPRARFRAGPRQGAGRAGRSGQRHAVAGIAAQRPRRTLRASAAQPARGRCEAAFGARAGRAQAPARGGTVRGNDGRDFATPCRPADRCWCSRTAAATRRY